MSSSPRDLYGGGYQENHLDEIQGWARFSEHIIGKGVGGEGHSPSL